MIGGLGIFHVFVAPFAIGGGFLMWWFEWLRQTGREPKAGAVIDPVLRVFILHSFVVGGAHRRGHVADLDPGLAADDRPDGR